MAVRAFRGTVLLKEDWYTIKKSKTELMRACRMLRMWKGLGKDSRIN